MPLLQRSPAKRAGFSFVEVVVTLVLLSSTLAVLLTILNAGYISSSINLTKIDLQHKAREALTCIVRDVRQTTPQEIKESANSPSSSHIKFRKYANYIMPVAVWSDYIEYTYNAASQTLTRRDYATGQERHFYHIASAPFVIDAAWISSADNQLAVTLTTQKTALGDIAPTFSLNAEVTIRNE